MLIFFVSTQFYAFWFLLSIEKVTPIIHIESQTNAKQYNY